jgi:hypothetical protein
MKMTPDDPRLSAWLLGELPADEAEWVECAVAEEPELAEEVRRMRELHALLDQALAGPVSGLLPEQVDEIRAAGRTDKARRRIIPLPVKRRSWTWLISTAAAAVVCGGLFIMARLPVGQLLTSHGARAPEVSSDADGRVECLPLPGPSGIPAREIPRVNVIRASADTPKRFRDMQTAALREEPEAFLRRMEKSLQTGQLPEMASLPPLERRGFVETGFEPGFELPVLAGRASFRWVSGYVRDRGELPPAPTVRLEELVNASAPGIFGVSKTASGVTVSVETISCKWKPSMLIAAIGIRGASDGTRNVEARMHLNKGAISKYRLLGFDPARGSGGSVIPHKVPKNESTVVLVEMQPSGKSSGFGRIGLAVGDAEKATAILDLPPLGAGGSSSGGSLAILMAGFSEWLSGSEGAPDPVLLDAMLREARAKNPHASGPQAEALALVADTLALARRNH